MQTTQLRKTVESSRQLIAFIPDPPSGNFYPLSGKGHLNVEAVSVSSDDGRSWVRGWSFTLINGNGELIENRYVDADEITEIRQLLRKMSDESAQLGYEYHSMEGVIFKNFHSNQRISFLTEGFALRVGVERAKVVQEVLDFMESSAKLWE